MTWMKSSSITQNTGKVCKVRKAFDTPNKSRQTARNILVCLNKNQALLLLRKNRIPKLKNKPKNKKNFKLLKHHITSTISTKVTHKIFSHCRCLQRF